MSVLRLDLAGRKFDQRVSKRSPLLSKTPRRTHRASRPRLRASSDAYAEIASRQAQSEDSISIRLYNANLTAIVPRGTAYTQGAVGLSENCGLTQRPAV